MKYQNTFRITSICFTILFLGLISASFAHAQNENYSFVKQWNSWNNSIEHFYNPFSVAVDSSGNVYVADYEKRIVKFDNNGNFITHWDTTYNNSTPIMPTDIAIDSSDNVWVDTESGVLEYSSGGKFIRNWTQDWGPWTFHIPRGLGISPSGNIYLASQTRIPGGAQIFVFTSDGIPITQWGASIPGNVVDSPYDVAVSLSGNVYVSDQGNNCVEEFTSYGTLITLWGSLGSGIGQFDGMEGIAVDSSSNVYVADTVNNRIQKFDRNGNFITQWGSLEGLQSNATGQFNLPTNVVVDSSSNVFVADMNNNRIEKFAVNNSIVQPTLPVANFTANVTEGYVPLDVQFNDSSQNATHLEWNFDDGSNNVSDANPEHVFNTSGLFNVVLTASNDNGSSSKNMTINVTAPPALQVFPGCTNLSTDPNHDGLYEDINGNGRVDFADVTTYFNNMAWIPQNEPVAYFDYNRNGRIDFSDVVMLFNKKSS